MLAKQDWRLLTNKNSLVAKIFKEKYYPNGDVLKAKRGSNPSYAWRSIYNNLEVIHRGTRWRMGNGKMINIWDDKWLPTPTSYKVISPPRDLDDFPMVSSLIDDGTKSWKSNLVRELSLPFEAETILRIPLSYNLPDDKIIWVGNKGGEFSIKSAYHIAANKVDAQVIGESSSGDVRAPFWKKVCESTTHALIHCDVAANVWSNWTECHIKLPDTIYEISDIALKLLNNGTNQDLKTLFSTSWFICPMKTISNQSRWTAPPSSYYKINVNGTTSQDHRPSSIGAIIRDSNGLVTATISKTLPVQNSVEEVEAIVLEIGYY
ncbi:uncharacterized protein LOC142628784 [Castanea sativa]|uniref:uncharacterized protein LOC142628784 n=1 Tax=Castanea sativa TaxID=21020 RepID=UPI003F64C1CD